VPSAGTHDPIRVVVDEASFDFRGLSATLIEGHLDGFNEAISDLRSDGITPWKPPMLEGVACSDEFELFEYLMAEPGGLIDRDTRTRFFGLVDKCPEWDIGLSINADVMLGGGDPDMAMSIAFAVSNVLGGHGIACLVFGGCARRGFLPVRAEAGQTDIFFFAEQADLKYFWRSLYGLEKVEESGFMTLVSRAFPDLDFYPDLTFRRFDGAYQSLMPEVVKHLSVLNDHFLNTYRSCNGLPHSVEAALGAFGCPGVSPESPNTRRNERVMKQRDVSYLGRTVRCEWHTKIEPHRNRIHFAAGDAYDASGKRILIGIFVDHLDT
jgi:hypothetical protein